MGNVPPLALILINGKLERLPEALPARFEPGGYFLKGLDSQEAVTIIRLLLAGGLLLALFARYYYEKHDGGGKEPE